MVDGTWSYGFDEVHDNKTKERRDRDRDHNQNKRTPPPARDSFHTSLVDLDHYWRRYQ